MVALSGSAGPVAISRRRSRLVAATEPTRIKANPAAMVDVRTSSRINTPRMIRYTGIEADEHSHPGETDQQSDDPPTTDTLVPCGRDQNRADQRHGGHQKAGQRTG